MDVSARSLVLPQVSYGTWCCYGISSKWLKTLERCRVNLCSRWQWIWLGIILCAKPEWVYIVVLKIILRPFVYSRHNNNRIWKVIFGSPIFLTIFFLKCKRNISLTIYYIKVKCCTKGYLKFEHIHKTIFWNSNACTEKAKLWLSSLIF